MKLPKKSKKIEEIVYSRDASRIDGKPLKVYFPESEEEVKKYIKENSSITPRGAGTGLAGGAVPNNSVVLDLSKMNKILDIDLAGKTAKVEAGVICDELNEVLEPYNLEFPVRPSSASVCTLGGMAATNASGIRAVKYGNMIEWIKELEIVDGRGDLKEIKIADLNDVIGMEGITGVITKLKLKLIDKKERTASLIKLEDLDRVIEQVKKIKFFQDISMIELLDKLASKSAGLEEQYHLLIEYESDKGSFKGNSYKEIISVREKVYPALAALGYVHIEDPKVFLAKLPDLIKWLEYNKIPFFSHIGIGIVHPVFKENNEKLIYEMMILVKKLGGKVTGEHGIGLSKRKFLEESDKKLIKLVKNRYDSLNKFNPGKVI